MPPYYHLALRAVGCILMGFLFLHLVGSAAWALVGFAAVGCLFLP